MKLDMLVATAFVTIATVVVVDAQQGQPGVVPGAVEGPIGGGGADTGVTFIGGFFPHKDKFVCQGTGTNFDRTDIETILSGSDYPGLAQACAIAKSDAPYFYVCPETKARGMALCGSCPLGYPLVDATNTADEDCKLYKFNTVNFDMTAYKGEDCTGEATVRMLGFGEHAKNSESPDGKLNMAECAAMSLAEDAASSFVYWKFSCSKSGMYLVECGPAADGDSQCTANCTFDKDPTSPVGVCTNRVMSDGKHKSFMMGASTAANWDQHLRMPQCPGQSGQSGPEMAAGSSPLRSSLGVILVALIKFAMT